jgi:ribulose-bisphosphate carboxylase large chain
MHSELFPFSPLRFSVDYRISGSESEGRAKAEKLCFDQTVELPDALVEPGPIRDHLIGRLEHVQPVGEHRISATVSFSCDLVGKDLTQLLNVVFGIASLKAGIRVTHLHLPDSFVRQWPGPRFGRPGLRHLLGITSRPLVCGVLKPVGLAPSVLAERAYHMALGGLDLIKDDQGLVDQSFCRFDERVSRCAEAVNKANQETGRKCLYMPNVTGSAKGIYKRSLFAKEAGAGGVLICPGLVGFDAVRIVAQDETLELPILTHPTLLGSLYMNPDHGMDPTVVYGQLPRLAGADVSIYPSYHGDFSLTKEDCRHIAKETTVPWAHLPPIFPTAAGGIHREQIKEFVDLYGHDVVIIVGGGLISGGHDLTATCQTLMKQIDDLYGE